MAARTLTERELNRALLARQMLLERADLPLTRAIERMGGVQTQYAPSAYIGLWSRLASFERHELTRALERRRVVQGTLMRSTIHIVSRRDYPIFAEGLRDGRREWWLRVNREADTRPIADAERRVRAFLADGPRRRKEILQHLGADHHTWNGIGLWLDLVRVPPSGTWEQRRADLYAVAADWIGPWAASKDEGFELLVRRYLGGFGPATVKEIANWAGLAPSVLMPALERVRLRRFVDERGTELLDLPRGILPDPDTPAPVRFLPTWDATLLVHARRTQILPERYRPFVFNTKTPHSVPTFLVDGQVAGTWRFDRGRVEPRPFESLPAGTRRELDDEADRLAAWMT